MTDPTTNGRPRLTVPMTAAEEAAEAAEIRAATLHWTLQGRYEDDGENPRLLHIEPGINHEATVTIDGADPVWVDGLDLLRLVSQVVLGAVYDPSQTEKDRTDLAAS